MQNNESLSYWSSASPLKTKWRHQMSNIKAHTLSMRHTNFTSIIHSHTIAHISLLKKVPQDWSFELHYCGTYEGFILLGFFGVTYLISHNKHILAHFWAPPPPHSSRLFLSEMAAVMSSVRRKWLCSRRSNHVSAPFQRAMRKNKINMFVFFV